MKIMAVDFGEARTGIAISDSMEMLASPVSVIAEKDADVTVEKIVDEALKLSAKLVVVGLPVNMDGSEGERARRCREISEKLEARLTVPVRLWDERGSTKTAIYYMNETDTRGKKRKQTIDAAAATVILQNYLDYRKNNPEQQKTTL